MPNLNILRTVFIDMVARDQPRQPLSRSALRAPRAKDMEIRFKLARVLELEMSHVQRWRTLQHNNPSLGSPCFSPEFSRAVAAAGRNVECALIFKDEKLEAIFPFERRSFGRGAPVGTIVSDYHGLICKPGFQLDADRLLRAARLASWDFTRCVTDQQTFASGQKLCEPSAVIDLREGFDHYCASPSVKRGLKSVNYQARRLSREIGPLKFVPHSKDACHLETVLRWKSQQYQRSGWRNLFAARWARRLCEIIQQLESETFSGMLSLLFAGEKLIAGHFGMRSRAVWQYWFPAYNRHFARYSPGLILLMRMAEHAAHLGIEAIDLGTGISPYKQRFANSSVPVAEGSIERNSLLRDYRGARRLLGRCLKRLRA